MNKMKVSPTINPMNSHLKLCQPHMTKIPLTKHIPDHEYSHRHTQTNSYNFSCKISIAAPLIKKQSQYNSSPPPSTSTPSLPNLNPLIKPPPPRQRPPPSTPPSPTLNPIQRAVAAALDAIESSLVVGQQKKRRLPRTIDPAVQLVGNFSPVQESPVVAGLEVLGRIPDGLEGVYLRNGANPMFPSSGGHHLFDGDGMIHAVKLDPGNNRASYCCRFTRTIRLVQEAAWGRALFPKPIGELHGHLGLARLALFYARAAAGLLNPNHGTGTANAGLVWFDGRLLAMSEDDSPYHVGITRDGDLETMGRFDFSGQVDRPLIAHPKVDPTTGDLHTLSYVITREPYLKYYRFENRGGRKSREVSVRLRQPTMIHDFAVTQNFVIIPDNQVVFELSQIIRGGSPLRFDPDKEARFGFLHKGDVDGSGIQWVEVPDSFCFHFMNAWEETSDRGEKVVVLIGSCMTPPDSIFNGKDDDQIRAELTEIRINLETGQSVKRVVVSGLNLEVGQVNKRRLGRRTRYVYMAITDPWPKCSGIAKVDLVTGDVSKFLYGKERYGGEPCFVPASGSGRMASSVTFGREDEGWLLSFVRDERKERSELVILRASDMKQVASVRIPTRVPYGFHGTFVGADELSHR